jgi:hypothetical protein
MRGEGIDAGLPNLYTNIKGPASVKFSQFSGIDILTERIKTSLAQQE